jgi:O-antigen ligase
MFYFIVFLTPLSIPLHEIMPGLDVDLHLPTEPLLALVLLVLVLSQIKSKRGYPRSYLIHPVSITIFINLLWILITSVTSTMPLVSFKFLLVRIWFLATFYFLALLLLQNQKQIRTYYWLYIIPLIVVIFYSITRQAGYGFDDYRASHFVMNPFYKDHTSYGAALAMFIPIVLGLIADKEYPNWKRLITTVVLVILTVAIILSNTRAAWLSLVGAVGVFVAIRFKISFKLIFLFLVAIGVILFSQRKDIEMALEKNKQDSSGELNEHLQSISNISSDASNLERINRWNCAMRMFKEKPFFGWGPGTYMFQYAPFQKPDEKTIISTNAGIRGNAHSEYLGPLSESGILGMITFIIIIITSITTGIRVFYKLKTRRDKIIIMGTLLGLITYFLHGFLNNFLDMDKISAPFWGFIAILVVYDVRIKEEEKNLEQLNA